MSHTHTYKEITRFEHNEQHFRCLFCGDETTKPFPIVNPYTGVVEPPVAPLSEAETLADQEQRIRDRISHLPE